ncbi:MAG: ABC transporter permease [Planctomycetes bacterium]|nr:ABC transporter permease [Planctomycetota bacterium]
MSAVAGPRLNLVSAVTIFFLAAFMLLVISLVAVDVYYTNPQAIGEVLSSPEVRHAIVLTLWTTVLSALLVVIFAIPMGYALSRYRFPGSVVMDALVDIPIVLPPVVIGVSLLVLFSTDTGRWIEDHGVEMVYKPAGIVLCQFLVSASYGIAASRAAFDAVDIRLEHLAMTLGCTRWGAFRRVALPLAANGVIAGSVLAWARAVGVFGPLMVFAGVVRMKTEVLATTVYLEISVGHIQPALAVALVMIALAMTALVIIHALGIGRRWWSR